MLKINYDDRFIAKSDWITVYTEHRSTHHAIALARHEGVEILLVDSGACELRIEQKRYRMRPGDCAFIAEGEHHSVSVAEACNFTFIDFRPERLFSDPALREAFLQPFFNGLGGGRHVWKGQAALVRNLRSLVRLCRSHPPRPIELAGRMLKIMQTFPRLPGLKSGRRVQSRLRVQPAVDLIMERYGWPLNVDRLAKSCDMSRATFKRVFQDATGKAPNRFLIEHRLNQAAALLAGTRRKVQDIALEAGFANRANFNRRFRAHFGVTPEKYRKK